MWLARDAASARCVRQQGITLAEGGVERFDDELVKSLVVCYKNTFHNYEFKNYELILVLCTLGSHELLLGCMLTPVGIELALLAHLATVTLDAHTTEDAEHRGNVDKG